ncbi:MAG: OmpA family protein [Pseudomonadota bacterium]
MSIRPSLRRSAAAAAVCAFVLGACAQGQGPSERQTAGAGLGALAGAGLGLLVGGDDRRNALVGAGIGLLAGVAVGSYLDEQERRLEQDLEGTGGTVERVGDSLLVTLPNGVTFDVDSAEIKREFRRPLNRVARTLGEYPSSYIDVVGHADATGSDAYNQQLSERRARAVADALSDRGVARARLAAIGRGETQPVASNDTERGRARNRRVEILIVPATAGA